MLIELHLPVAGNGESYLASALCFVGSRYTKPVWILFKILVIMHCGLRVVYLKSSAVFFRYNEHENYIYIPTTFEAIAKGLAFFPGIKTSYHARIYINILALNDCSVY